MIAIAAIAALAEDPGVPAPVEAWIVLAGDPAPDEGKALIHMAKLMSEGVPRHAEYPQVTPLDPYGGQGFGVAVTVTKSKAAAEKLHLHLKNRGITSSVHPSAMPAEDMRLLAIDEVKVTGNGAPLFPYQVCFGPPDSDECWSVGTLDPQRSFVVPFAGVAEGAPGVLRVTAGDPWTCPIVDVGGVKTDMPVWLKSPVEVPCYEDSTPKKRKKGD